MSDEQEKTHVLTSDCIISEIGRCEAGTMLSESLVLPSTWQWLHDRNFLKSVEEIEQEADSEDSEDEPKADEADKPEDEPKDSEVVSQSALDFDLPPKGRKARK